MALRLFAICNHDDQRHALPDEARIVGCRDLAAIVGAAPYTAHRPDDETLALHRRVVDAAFTHGEVLPAPPGTIFRAESSLQRWMDLHYVALSDALSYVADRLGARVRIARTDGDADEAEAGTDLASTAGDVMRTLRRRAVAAVPLRREHTTGIAVGSAFLVERTLWREFEHEVETMRVQHPDVEISMSGPWPPYDFVQIDFGS